MTASERIVGLYERHAAEWDAARGRSLFERAWLDRLAGELEPGAPILDIGCGAGEPIATYLIGRGFALTGLDASPSMIALCRKRFPSAEWVVGDMRTIALGRRFAGLIAWDSFFHLAADDQRATLPRFATNARPGAMLLFTSGPAAGEAIGSWQGQPLYHASLDPEEYARRLGESGLTVVAHRAEDPGCGGHTVWLARYEGS